MQRITNIELLQLSYWSPAKDMKSVIEGIKSFLQQWARIEEDYERNELSRCPYLDIEHHLLTLAQVSCCDEYFSVPDVNHYFSHRI